jgi:hypothetical protein
MLWSLVLIVSAMAGGAPAEPQHRWQQVLREPGRTVYIDAASAQQLGESRYRAWARFEHRGGGANASGQTVSQREYDCDSGRVRVLSLTLHGTQGPPRELPRGSAEWTGMARRVSDTASTRAACRSLRMLWPRADAGKADLEAVAGARR